MRPFPLSTAPLLIGGDLLSHSPSPPSKLCAPSRLHHWTDGDHRCAHLGLAAFKVYEQELSIDRIALARAVDTRAALVQERLRERELLTRVAVGLFRTPSINRANALQPLRSSIYAFETDFVVAGWIARVPVSQLAQAQAELKAAAAIPIQRFATSTMGRLTSATLRDSESVLMDVEPKDDETKSFGRPRL